VTLPAQRAVLHKRIPRPRRLQEFNAHPGRGTRVRRVVAGYLRIKWSRASHVLMALLHLWRSKAEKSPILVFAGIGARQRIPSDSHESFSENNPHCYHYLYGVEICNSLNERGSTMADSTKDLRKKWVYSRNIPISIQTIDLCYGSGRTCAGENEIKAQLHEVGIYLIFVPGCVREMVGVEFHHWLRSRKRGNQQSTKMVRHCHGTNRQQE
jgi:hypothetical protein